MADGGNITNIYLVFIFSKQLPIILSLFYISLLLGQSGVIGNKIFRFLVFCFCFVFCLFFCYFSSHSVTFRFVDFFSFFFFFFSSSLCSFALTCFFVCVISELKKKKKKEKKKGRICLFFP